MTRPTTTAPPRSQVGLTIGLCTAVVAVAFEVISVATAMPAAARDLDGLDLYAWAFSLFLIGQLFATVAAGRVCDRIGPARPMAGGVGLFAVGLVVAATSATMLQLVVGRLLQGLGAGVVSIAMYVVIARAYDESQRPTMFSYISSAWVLPSFVGPSVSAWLTHQVGWRSVFWSVLPVLAVGAAMMLPRVFAVADGPPEGEPVARPGVLVAAALAAVGAAGIQAAGQRLGLTGLLLGVAGLVAVGVSLPRLMPPAFFRFRPGLSPVVVVRALIAGTFFGSEAFVPLMLVEQRHLSLLLAGSTLTVGALGWSTGSWVQSRRWLRIGRNRVITVGAVLVAGGIGLVTLVTWQRWWVGLVALAWVLAGLGMGMAMAGTSLATMTLSRSGEEGRNASSLQFGEAFGAGVLVGIGGTVFAALHDERSLTVTFGSVFLVMLVVGVLAVLVSLRVGPVRSPAPSQG